MESTVGANKVVTVRDTYDRTSPPTVRNLTMDEWENEFKPVRMADEDWTKVIEALEYLSRFSSTALNTTSEEFSLLADSIRDVVDGL